MYLKACALGYILCSSLSIGIYAVRENYLTMPKGSVGLPIPINLEIRTRASFASPSLRRPGGFGPGGSTLADMYCAYCRRRGLIACIRRWCYSRIIGIPPSISEQSPSLGIPQTVPFTNALAHMTPSVRGPSGFGPGGSTLADMYCAYCRRRGLTACIRRWCYRRITDVSPAFIEQAVNTGQSVTASFADRLASFLARRDPNLANIYCAYCRRHGLVDCIRRWCYSRRTIMFGIKQIKLY